MRRDQLLGGGAETEMLPIRKRVILAAMAADVAGPSSPRGPPDALTLPGPKFVPPYPATTQITALPTGQDLPGTLCQGDPRGWERQNHTEVG